MSDISAMEKLKNLVKIKKFSCQLDSDAQAALVTSETNIRYLTEFANSEGTMLITRGKRYLLVDFRYGEAAKKKAQCCDVVVYDSFNDSLKDLLVSCHIDEVLVEASDLTLGRANRLRKVLNDCGCKMISNDKLDRLLSNLRILKTDAEIAKMEKAQKITEEAYIELLNYVRVGARECDLALELEYLMRKKGASGVAFDLITITGKKTSMPHGVPDESVIQSGDFVTFDIGAVYDGYHSDMTRTVAVGDISDEQREVYDIVLKAQLAGLDKVKAGVKACDVDKTVRDIITEHGYGDYYKHATGHGVGLEIHEQPTVSPKSSYILSSGMVITVEPGIYLPGKFGVRIEDMVAVTSDGCKNFASLSKKLIIV